MLRVATWQLAHPNTKRTTGRNGHFNAGIFAAYKTTRSPALWKALLDMGEKNKWNPGPRFDHADDIAIAQTYIDIYRIAKDKRCCVRRSIRWLVSARIRVSRSRKTGSCGGGANALFMAPPTLAKLVETTGDRSYLDLSDRLFQETYDRLYNKGEHLYARDASYLVNEKVKENMRRTGKRSFGAEGTAGLPRPGPVTERTSGELSKRQFYLKQYQEIVERVQGCSSWTDYGVRACSIRTHIPAGKAAAADFIFTQWPGV